LIELLCFKTSGLEGQEVTFTERDSRVNVIIFIQSQYFGSVDLFEKQVYVALTRTRQNLIVLNSNKRYIEFGRKLSNKWS